MMTLNELTAWVHAHLPHAIIDEDESGELRITTGLKLDKDDVLHPVSEVTTHAAVHLAHPIKIADASSSASGTPTSDDVSFASIVCLVVEAGPDALQKIARIFAVYRWAVTRAAQKGCTESEPG